MKRYYLYIVILMITFGSSCKKFVEVEPPMSKLVKKTVFEEDLTAQTAVYAMYSNLRDYGFLTPGISWKSYAGTTLLLSLYSDELVYEGSNLTGINSSFFNNDVLPTNASIENAFWLHPFKAIYMANSILEGVDASDKMSKKAKDRVKGDALFVRAIVHFYLTNCFGSVPYVTTVDYNTNKSLGKIEQDKVYIEVLKDLLDAESLLEDNYIDLERIRPNKATIKALLARVYLYKKDWENARKKATEVINLTNLYKLETDLDKVFLKTSGEAIWQFKPYSDVTNTHEGDVFVPRTYNDNSGVNVSTVFLNSMELDDQRRTHWFGQYVKPSAGLDIVYSSKYKEYANSQPSSREFSIVFRLAEMYLIRAEAYAQEETLDLALQDLDAIRGRAGLLNSTAVSQEDVLNAILQERRVEFFSEMGHRWFDLKRSGKAANYLKSLKPNWNVNHLILPLPEKELLANRSLLPQNEGYE